MNLKPTQNALALLFTVAGFMPLAVAQGQSQAQIQT